MDAPNAMDEIVSEGAFSILFICMFDKNPAQKKNHVAIEVPS